MSSESHHVINEDESLLHSNKSGSTKIMSKTRLEAFSDGVIAIIITVMVLDLKVQIDVCFLTFLFSINEILFTLRRLNMKIGQQQLVL